MSGDDKILFRSREPCIRLLFVRDREMFHFHAIRMGLISCATESKDVHSDRDKAI